LAELIEVAFKGNRKEFFHWDGADALAAKTAVIVEVDRGEDLGRVHATGELAEKRCGGCAHGCGTGTPARRILRLATPDEARRAADLRAQDEDARRRAMEKVKAHGLVMKLTDAEWQFDRRKLTIYFTADKRVDFRALVRDLAATFRARIELKQIGVRDEAKRLSGIGRCGREYCSASWLPELRPVNLQIAKDQRLSLNPSQISGACGRLMCCLRYEHEFYVAARKRFPKEGRTLATARGEEKVLSTDIFRERVTLLGPDGETRVLALADLKREMGAPDAGDPAEPTEASEAASARASAADEIMPDESPRGGSGSHERERDRARQREPQTGAAPRAGPTAHPGPPPPPDEARREGDTRPRRRGRRGGRRFRSDGDGKPRGDDPSTS
jgi:cell fate regulator YaaT (PSP1 superfamily)